MVKSSHLDIGPKYGTYAQTWNATRYQLPFVHQLIEHRTLKELARHLYSNKVSERLTGRPPSLAYYAKSVFDSVT